MDAGMKAQRERLFETALIEELTQDWDLPVRRGGESMERRRRGGATLAFKYHYGSEMQAKVTVSIEGAAGFSSMLLADFSTPESTTRSAEDCEGLALFLMEHVQHAQDAMIDQYARGALPYGRREDDC